MCSINHDLELIFVHTPKCGGLFIESLLENKYGFKTEYLTHENHSDFVKSSNENIVNSNKNPHGFLNINVGGVLQYYMSSKKHDLKMKMTEEKWLKYKKIAVLRNPYDRFISCIKYLEMQNSSENTGIVKEHDGMNEILTKINIDEINDYIIKIKKYMKDKDKQCSYNYFHLFITQRQQLLNLNNKIDIDFFIRFENLNADICDILLKCGIPKIKHRDALTKNFKVNETVNSNFYHYYDEDILNFVNEHFHDDFQEFGFKKVYNLDDLLLQSKIYHKNIEDFVGDNINLLIELDNKNLIYTAEEMISNNNQGNTNTNEQEQNNNIFNNMLLPNGISIDFSQSEQKRPVIRDHNFHMENIFKLLENLSKKK
jgi:hypothetical protein